MMPLLSIRLHQQAGAALLSAMLTVTLVATFAAAALWQQYRSLEVEKSERSRVQTAWLLVGALDFSRHILRLDGQEDNKQGIIADTLAENWAGGLPETRLSTFLAADQNNTGGMTAEESVDAFISGEIVDAQSRLNVINLIDINGAISIPDKEAFGRLFDLLNLPKTELDDFVDKLKIAKDTTVINGAAPLMPQRVRQLMWLGLRASSLTKLKPHISLITDKTLVNLNTASAEVIHAAAPSIQMAEAKAIVSARQTKPFTSTANAEKVVSGLTGKLTKGQYSVDTHFFDVIGRLRFEDTVVEEHSLVKRDMANNVTLKTIWRERAVVASPEASP